MIHSKQQEPTFKGKNLLPKSKFFPFWADSHLEGQEKMKMAELLRQEKMKMAELLPLYMFLYTSTI